MNTVMHPSFVNRSFQVGTGVCVLLVGVAGAHSTTVENSRSIVDFECNSIEHTEERLHQIMVEIHRVCYETSAEFGAAGNYVLGANIVGFKRVAEAMIAFGLI